MVLHGVYRACLVVLILLAGCAGISGEAVDRDDGPTETVTPVAVPDDPVDRSAGVDDGVTDSAALANAHDERLSERSYRLVSNQTIRYENGSIRSQYKADLRLAADRGYRVTVETAGPEGPLLLGEPPATAVFWSDGETYIRAFGESDVIYNEFAPSRSGVGTWEFWASTGAFGGLQSPNRMIGESFEAVPTRVDGNETVDGIERHRIVGEGGPDTDLPFPEASPARNVDLLATVDEDGLVRYLELEYDGYVDGDRVLVTRSISYSDAGATDVDRPEWYDEAT